MYAEDVTGDQITNDVCQSWGSSNSARAAVTIKKMVISLVGLTGRQKGVRYPAQRVDWLGLFAERQPHVKAAWKRRRSLLESQSLTNL